jgi:hypothetical protein
LASAVGVSTIFVATAFFLFVTTGTLAAIALFAGAWAYWPAALLPPDCNSCCLVCYATNLPPRPRPMPPP